MLNQDELLQQSLESLENGTPLVEVLSGLPESSNGLAPIVRLAAAVRSVDHPDIWPGAAQAQKQALMDAARARPRTNPIARPRLFPWSFSPVLSGALALVVLAFISVTLLGLALYTGPASAQTAMLVNVQGTVEIAPAGGEAWRPAGDGEQVREGDRLRTGLESGATLVFFEGSRTRLDAQSEVGLPGLQGSWTRSLKVALEQSSGRTESNVVPLKGGASRFQILTPAGEANVHGTVFSVRVGEAGQAQFAVKGGQVQVQNGDSQVLLHAGQAVASAPGLGLDEPAYQFSLSGSLEQEDAREPWFVSGVPFTVLPQTILSADIGPGDRVEVEGRVLPDGEWVADSLSLAEEAQSQATFAGELESMNGKTWQVGGWKIRVDEDTELDPGLTLGQPVEVHFVLIEQGLWQALSVLPIQDETQEVFPTLTSSPVSQTVLVFVPESQEISGCGAAGGVVFSGQASLVSQDGSQPAPDSPLTLNYQIEQGAEYVSAVVLAPDRWDALPESGRADFSIQVNLDPEAWASAPLGTEVVLRLSLDDATQAGSFRFRIRNACQSTSTPTPEETEILPSSTPVLTPTLPLPTAILTDTLPLTPTPEGEALCTGAQPHPTGTRLAERYGVPYAEIMGWFCQGFGFGEIELAYDLSAASGKSVGEIFEMRSSGLGWGEIEQQLDPLPPTATPGPDDQDPGNGKGEEKDPDKDKDKDQDNTPPRAQPTKKPKDDKK